jgi:hypothetical protein
LSIAVEANTVSDVGIAAQVSLFTEQGINTSTDFNVAVAFLADENIFRV